MKFRKSVTAAVTLLALGCGASQAQNLLNNGSFEDNSQLAGTWQIYSDLVGWNGAKHGIELRNNVAGSAQDGRNFIELDTTQNSSMFQDILAGGLVELSFWYSARPGTSRQGTNRVSFGLGDSFAGTVLRQDINLTQNHQWQQYTSLVDLGGYGTHRLTFAAEGRSNSYGGSLDNVSVTAVPEPESYAMMLAGLGLIGAIARRRKQQKQNA